MKIRMYSRTAAIVIALMLAATPLRLAAQATGSVEFTARVAPSDGRPEPVRELTFYLLGKSLSDIHQEALQLEPPPDLDAFVDSLTVSPKLKEWMKKNHTVELNGKNLPKSLSADDVVDVPEFYNAYILRNSGYEGSGFPKPQFKLKDEVSKPAKFMEGKADYKEAVRKFAGANPDSLQGIESELIDVDPSTKWKQITFEQSSRLEKRTLDLAQTRYLVAQTDTNLDGRGRFTGLPPGTYWMNLLGTQAISGDVRLRWDFPVTVRAGESVRVELSNLNAVKSYSAAQNRNQ